MLKIPWRILRKIPEKIRVVFGVNTFLQSKNLCFYYYKMHENIGKFREKFPGNFPNSENSRKFPPEIFPKIPGKFPENCGVF